MPPASLPLELWSLIESFVPLRRKWRLLGVCRHLRDAVYESVQTGLNPAAPRFKSREQTLAYVAVALLGRSVFLTGGAGMFTFALEDRTHTRGCTSPGKWLIALCASSRS